MISGFAKVTQCYYAGDLTNIFLIQSYQFNSFMTEAVIYRN